MRALRFEQFGPPSVLQLVDLPRPTPSADEALIEVKAAAINPSDLKNVEGWMAQTRPPRTPGRDFAGVVAAGPPAWRGVAVWGTGGELGFTRDGTHAEAVVVPVGALSRKPACLSFVEAAAVGTPFVTAQLGLSRASVDRGSVVLVAGAAGSVGGAAVQLARWRGATVIGLVRRAAQAEAVRALGAEQVIVHPDGATTETLQAALGPTRIDIAFDTTGWLLDTCVHVLAQQGRVVAIAAPPDGRIAFHLRELYRRDGSIIGVDSLRVTAVQAAALLDELARGFESGALAAPRSAERPLDQAMAAYQDRGGKQVLVPG